MSSRSLLALVLRLYSHVSFSARLGARAECVHGNVKDTSGAVMPGVTVEAASPALIEKVRSAITDENGAYRIIDLRPGNYTLTFTLPGFNTVIARARAAVNFIATINIDLAVGTLQESVTVSGASPRRRRAEQRQAAGADPRRARARCRPPAPSRASASWCVGVTLERPDVGGSRAMQQTYFVVRGQGGAQTVVMVDGLMTNGLMGDGAVQAYHNEAMTQEAVYKTAGGNAETITGGVNMNLIPKDGGNQFTGGFKALKSPDVVAGRQPDRRPARAQRHARSTRSRTSTS